MSQLNPRPLPAIPVGPAHRSEQWEKIKEVKEPFPGNPKENTFEFWFNYFWAEVVALATLTQVQKVKVTETFLSVFQWKAASSGGGHEVRPDFAARHNQFRENVLRQLLLLGFRRVNLGAVPAPSLPSRVQGLGDPLHTVDAKDLQLQLVQGRDGGQLPIAFRSDTRSWWDLIKQGGFLAKARSQGQFIHKKMGLDEQWNPFNNPVYANSLWVRLGTKNQDNCLQTVVSCGAGFSQITHFPILSDYVLNFAQKGAEGRFLALKPFDEWTAGDVAAAKGHWLALEVDPATKTTDFDYLVKNNCVYVFHCRGLQGFNTQQYFPSPTGEGFPERGMAEIPIGHFLAAIPFKVRWWYNPLTGLQVHDLVFSPIRWRNMVFMEALLGTAGLATLKGIIDTEIDRSCKRQEFLAEQMARRVAIANKHLLLTKAERAAILPLLKASIAQKNPKAPYSFAQFHKNHLKAALQPQFGDLTAKLNHLGNSIDIGEPWRVLVDQALKS